MHCTHTERAQTYTRVSSGNGSGLCWSPDADLSAFRAQTACAGRAGASTPATGTHRLQTPARRVHQIAIHNFSNHEPRSRAWLNQRATNLDRFDREPFVRVARIAHLDGTKPHAKQHRTLSTPIQAEQRRRRVPTSVMRGRLSAMSQAVPWRYH